MTHFSDVPQKSLTDTKSEYLQNTNIVPKKTITIIKNILWLLNILSPWVGERNTRKINYKITCSNPPSNIKIEFTVMDKDRAITVDQIDSFTKKFQNPTLGEKSTLYVMLVQKILKKLSASELEYSESQYWGHQFRFTLNCKYLSVPKPKKDLKNPVPAEESISFKVESTSKNTHGMESSSILKFNPIDSFERRHKPHTLSELYFSQKVQSRNIYNNKKKSSRIGESLTERKMRKPKKIKSGRITTLKKGNVRASVLERYKEDNSSKIGDSLWFTQVNITPRDGTLTRESFGQLRLTSGHKKKISRLTNISSLLDRKIVPSKPGKEVVISPSQLVNLDPKTRMWGCPRLLSVSEDFFDRAYIEGLIQLHNITSEFVPTLVEAVDLLTSFPKSHFWCPGYQTLFLFYYENVDLAHLYSIQQLKNEGRIWENLKVYIFTNLKDKDVFQDLEELGVEKVFVKPVQSQEVQKVFE